MISSARVYTVAMYCVLLCLSSTHSSDMNLSYASVLRSIFVWCVNYGLACAYIRCARIVVPLLVHIVIAHAKL